MRNFLRYSAVVALCTILAACSNEGGGGSTGTGQTQFSKSITFSELQDTLASGPARVEISLSSGSLKARRMAAGDPDETADKMEVKGEDELTNMEEIDSPIIAINVDTQAQTGSLTLELNGLIVNFSAAGTEFKDERGTSNAKISFDEFVSRVQAALDAGGHPPVEAKRNPPPEPQDPNDSTFFATKLELNDMADNPKIEMNVDEDNLESNPDSSSDGSINLLGLTIGLAASSGETELEEESEDVKGEVEFEGIVQSVNLDANSFTLTNSTVVRIVEGTEIEDSSGDNDSLASLSAVADALAAGNTVKAKGEGVIEVAEPLTIDAIEVEFKVIKEEENLPQGEIEFEGKVTSVDVSGNTFTLADGTVVSMTNTTIINPEGDLLTLQAVSDAVAAGKDVKAEGDATGSTPSLTAVDVKFEVEEEEENLPPAVPAAIEFEGKVTQVDVPGNKFTLADGTSVNIMGTTTIDPQGDLLTLQAVADAIAAGDDVRAEGDATVTTAGTPPTLSAIDVKFEVDENEVENELKSIVRSRR